jgi:hypothetical protein
MATLFEFIFCMIFAISIRRFIHDVKPRVNKNKEKPAITEYNHLLYEYNMLKQQYSNKCNNFIYTNEIMKCENFIYQGQIMYGYKHGCGKMIYYNGYSYEGFWENNTANGFGMYIDDNDNVLISGNKINNKYDGLVKFHLDFVSNANVTKFECLYTDGVRKNCYVEYNNNITYIVPEIVLEKMDILKNTIL